MKSICVTSTLVLLTVIGSRSEGQEPQLPEIPVYFVNDMQGPVSLILKSEHREEPKTIEINRGEVKRVRLVSPDRYRVQTRDENGVLWDVGLVNLRQLVVENPGRVFRLKGEFEVVSQRTIQLDSFGRVISEMIVIGNARVRVDLDFESGVLNGARQQIVIRHSAYPDGVD